MTGSGHGPRGGPCGQHHGHLVRLRPSSKFPSPSMRGRCGTGECIQFGLCLVLSIHPPMAAKEISTGLRPPLLRLPITLQMKSHPKPSLRLRTSLLSTSGAHVLLFPIPLPGPSYAVLSRPLSSGFEGLLLCLPDPWSDFRVKRRCLLCEALL